MKFTQITFIFLIIYSLNGFFDSLTNNFSNFSNPFSSDKKEKKEGNFI